MTVATVSASPAPTRPARRHRPPKPSSTPRTLRAAAVTLSLLLGMLTAVAGGAVLARQSAVRVSGTQTEPLLVDAQTLYVALSDADTTAAGGLLAGPIEPAGLATRYQRDVATAAAAVDAAQGVAAGDPTLESPLRTLAVGLPFYTATVDHAAAENRLGYPVGGAYQGEASTYMRSTLLPAAESAYAHELTALADEQQRGSLGWPVVLAAVLLVVTVVVLVVVQVWTRRRFHRSLNVGLLLAVVAVVAGAGWLAIAVRDEGDALARVATAGTARLTMYSQARILMLQADGDDELALLTHEAVPQYQEDYAKVWSELSGAVQRIGDARLSDDLGALQDVHTTIRAQVTSNQYPTAISLATDPQGAMVGSLPEASANVDADLSSGVAGAQARFAAATDDAAGSLRGLAVGLVVLGLGAWTVAVLGLRARLREFR
jgi:hypothetical protein